MSFGHHNASRVLQSRTLLSQLANPLTQQSAFQANGAPPDRRRVVFTAEGQAVLQEPCVHAEKVYETPERVPITVCEHCSSIVVPETAHSVVARAVPLPHSMMRDDRWQQLLQMYNEQWRVKSNVQAMLRDHEALLVRLHRWSDAYTRTGALVDYRAQHNPMYKALEDSIKRVANVVTGFEQTIDSMLVDARRKLLREVQRCVPRRQEDFVRAMKRLIGETRRAPLFHPNAGSKCTLCDDAQCFVMLHSPTRSVQVEESARLRQTLFGLVRTGDDAQAEQTGTDRPCSCREFSVCIDCLLKWYWESSQALTKTFAQCPLCRADFQLEDIVPIYDGSAARQEASRQQAPAEEIQHTNNDQSTTTATQIQAHQPSGQEPQQTPMYHANISIAPQSLGSLVEALWNEPANVDWSQVSQDDQQYLLFHFDLPLESAHAATSVALDENESDTAVDFATLDSAQSSAESDADNRSDNEDSVESSNTPDVSYAAGAA